MRKLKVLSLDGGGMRGVISATLMDLFCQQAGIPKDKIYEHFDIIAGTSIGGISALGYSLGFTPGYVRQMLIDNGPNIFSVGVPGFRGQAGTGTWTGYLTGVYSSLYYNTKLIELVNNTFGTKTLQDMKTKVLIPAFQTLDKNNNESKIPVYFSNIASSSVPGLSGQNYLVKDVALSTSAAPVYFPAWKVASGETYVDGGVFLNNPSAMALSIIRALNPLAKRFCVLSVGTGLGNLGYIPSDTPSNNETRQQITGPIDNLNTIKMVMDVSMAIPPEGVSREIELISRYTLGNTYYCRLQYPIDPAQNPDSSLDNASSSFIQYMQDSATQYFNNNLADINNFIGHLQA